MWRIVLARAQRRRQLGFSQPRWGLGPSQRSCYHLTFPQRTLGDHTPPASPWHYNQNARLEECLHKPDWWYWDTCPRAWVGLDLLSIILQAPARIGNFLLIRLQFILFLHILLVSTVGLWDRVLPGLPLPDLLKLCLVIVKLGRV